MKTLTFWHLFRELCLPNQIIAQYNTPCSEGKCFDLQQFYFVEKLWMCMQKYVNLFLDSKIHSKIVLLILTFNKKDLPQPYLVFLK